MRKLLLTAALGALTLGLAGGASAAIVFETGADGPANKNVDWNQEAGGDLFVNGFINNTTIGVIVEGEEDIKTSSQGGVVWIVPTLDTGLTFLKFSLAPGYDFGAFEVDLKDPTGNNPTWSVTFETDNGATQTFNNFNGGFISAYGDAGERIKSVEFRTNGDITGVGQVRFGDIAAVVPEPGTWALMILGFGGAGAMLRRRRTVLQAS